MLLANHKACFIFHRNFPDIMLINRSENLECKRRLPNTLKIEVMYKTCNRTRPNRTYGNYRTYPTEPTGITERSGPNIRKMPIYRYWNLASIPVVGKIKDRCMEERFLYINARDRSTQSKKIIIHNMFNN